DAAFAERNGRCIRDLQERGLADHSLDPLLAAAALSGMVCRMAYSTYVLGDDCDFEELVATITTLWLNALRISPAGGPARPYIDSDERWRSSAVRRCAATPCRHARHVWRRPGGRRPRG